MAGYLNRFIDLPFPDLGGEDPETGAAVVWVRIRNPRLIPVDHLMAKTTRVKVGPDGQPVEVDLKAQETYERMSNLIVAGYVWDALSLDEEPPLLPMPPSPDDVSKMPITILNSIGEELIKANPR
jgi:hypothetical protein